MGTTVNGEALPFHCIAELPLGWHVVGMAATSKTLRRKNFSYLVANVWGNHRSLVADALGFGQVSLVTRYLSDGKSSKPIGDELARKIETAARAAGAAWVENGWLDVPHEGSAPTTLRPQGKRATFDERIKALPHSLRQYMVMELEICEQVRHVMPADFLRPPTRADRPAFQQYIERVLGEMGGKQSAA